MEVSCKELKNSIWSRFTEAVVIDAPTVGMYGIDFGRRRFFAYLLGNMLFRFKMIFLFSGLGVVGKFIKAIFLLVLGLPLIVVELIGFVYYAVFSIIPIIEFLIRVMVTLSCGIISTVLYSLIIAPTYANVKARDVKYKTVYLN